MSWELDTLEDSELDALIGALDVGVLAEGVSLAGLQSVLPDGEAEVLRALRDLEASGWQPSQLGTLCRLVKEARQREERMSRKVNLVLSGPPADGVFMRDTGAVFREMVKEARRELVVATYAVYNGRELFAELAEKLDGDEGFEAVLYLDVARKYGDTTRSSQLVARYRQDFENQWPGMRLPRMFYFNKSLETDWEKRASMHAKVVVADSRKVFIGSANLTRAAQIKNLEVGLVVEDVRQAKRIVSYLAGLEQRAFVRF